MDLSPLGQRNGEKVSVNVPGPTLTFQNISYAVRDSRGPCRKRAPEREILKNVSGIMKTGLNAIMGATGSGKTSLLDVIAGRKDPRGLRSGQVLVDNKVVTSELRLISAYVVQDDILMGTLSVRENLMFSGHLRLPRHQYSTAEKEKKVTSVLRELGLEDCADTKIGTEFLRDEPTTGLDSNTANSIVALLHSLSRSGKTIIFSIHQPRYSIFRLFDHLTLLHKGECVYAGPANETIQYFNDMGYECEAFNNPADFFLDIMNGEVSPSVPTGKSLPSE